MTRPKLTSHADRDVVESFLERGYLLVEGTPSPTLMGDLLDAKTLRITIGVSVALLRVDASGIADRLRAS